MKDPDKRATDVVSMFASQLLLLNWIEFTLSRTRSAPLELVNSIVTVHSEFPVLFIDPYSTEAVLLCRDSVHLLKGNRNKFC